MNSYLPGILIMRERLDRFSYLILFLLCLLLSGERSYEKKNEKITELEGYELNTITVASSVHQKIN